MATDALTTVRTRPGSGDRAGRAEFAYLLALPVLAFALMNFKPVVQNGFLDPYIYTGYVNNFSDLFDRYGATYYGVRFGLIFPGHVTTVLFGPVAGYFVLRYVLSLIAGIPFYVLVRQRYGRTMALAAVTLLMTSPFLARALLWDHPDAAGVPYLLAAICLWSIEHRRRGLMDAAAGACAGLALHCNIFVLAPLGLYLSVFALCHAGWQRGIAPLVRRLGVLAAGVAAVTAFGVAYYWWRVERWDIFTVTFTMSQWLMDGNMAGWRTPGFEWVMRQWWVLTPAILAALVPLAWRRAQIEFDDAVFWIGSAGVFLLYFVFQFLLNGNLLELFYYFSYTLPFFFLLVTIVLAAVWERATERDRRIGLAAALAGAIGPWVLYSFEIGVLPRAFAQHLTVAASSVVLVVLALRMTRVPRAISLAASAGIGLTLFSSFAAPGARLGDVYVRMVNSRINPDRLELDVYRVALQFMSTVPQSSRRPGALRFWYSSDPADILVNSVQSTYLWGYSRLQRGDLGLPYLGEQELRILQNPRVKWLGLLAEKPEQLAVGRKALAEHGIPHASIERHALSAGSYTLHFELLDLQKPDEEARHRSIPGRAERSASGTQGMTITGTDRLTAPLSAVASAPRTQTPMR